MTLTKRNKGGHVPRSWDDARRSRGYQRANYDEAEAGERAAQIPVERVRVILGPGDTLTYTAGVRLRAEASGECLLTGSMTFTAEPVSPDAWGWWYLTGHLGPVIRADLADRWPVDVTAWMRGQGEPVDLYADLPDGTGSEWLGDLGWDGSGVYFPGQAVPYRFTPGVLAICRAMLRAWWPTADLDLARRDRAPLVTYDGRIMELVPVRIPDRLRKHEAAWSRRDAACPLIRTEVPV